MMATAEDLTTALVRANAIADAHQTHIDHLTHQAAAVRADLVAATSTLADVIVRIHSWIEDHSVTDHHAHEDLVAELETVRALLSRAYLVGRQS